MGDAAVDQEKDVSLGDAEEDEEEYVDSEEVCDDIQTTKSRKLKHATKYM